jgi:hypothetical protein
MSIRHTLPAYFVVFAVLMSTSSALADAPTHRFNLVGIHTDNHYDCGGGSCTSACVLDATLTNLKYNVQEGIQVVFQYKNPVVDGGLASVSYQFEAIPIGATSQKLEEEFPGFVCKRVDLKEIKVNCPEAGGGRCSGFVNVRVPDIPVLKVKKHSISQ